MSRQVFLLGTSLCLLAMAFLLTDHLVEPSGISLANARRLHTHTTPGQAEAIFGRPAEDTSPLRGSFNVYLGSTRRWNCSTVSVRVHFRRDFNQDKEMVAAVKCVCPRT